MTNNSSTYEPPQGEPTGAPGAQGDAAFGASAPEFGVPAAGNTPGSTDSGSQGTKPPAGEGFFRWIRSLGVTRTDDSWIAGVCGGVATRTGLDPLLVRGIVVVLAILGGPMVLAYLVGWALLPNPRGRIHTEQAFRGVFDYPVIAILVLFVLTWFPFSQGVWFQGDEIGWGFPDWIAVTFRVFWTLAIIGGAIWLLVVISRRRKARYASYANGSAPTTGAAAPHTSTAGSAATDAPDGFSAPSAAAFTAGSTDYSSSSGFSSSSEYSSSSGYSSSSTSSTSAGPADPAADAAWKDPYGINESMRSANRAVRESFDSVAQSGRDYEAEHYATRPGAGFVAITIGLAVIASALVAASGFFAPLGSIDMYVAGLITLLAVMAIGLIVAGLRGRRGGGLAFTATVTALVLAFVWLLPQGAIIRVISAGQWAPTDAAIVDDASYVSFAGNTVVNAIDLSDETAGSTIDVWLGFGRSEIIVPEGIDTVVEGHILAGDFRVNGVSTPNGEGLYIDDQVVIPAEDKKDRGTQPLTIRVWQAAGQANVMTSQSGASR